MQVRVQVRVQVRAKLRIEARAEVHVEVRVEARGGNRSGRPWPEHSIMLPKCKGKRPTIHTWLLLRTPHHIYVHIHT